MPQLIDEKNDKKNIEQKLDTIIKQNEDIKKAVSYVELKLNTLMKETYSIDANEVKWDDVKQEQVPKTVLEVWKASSKYKKEDGNEQQY